MNTQVYVAITSVLANVILAKVFNRPKMKDYLEQCLSKGIPSVTNNIVSEYGDCARILIDSKAVIVTADSAVAYHIFKTKNHVNYIERFGDDDGLKMLGMFNNGVIWNNNNKLWSETSKIFRSSITEDTRKKASTFSLVEAACLMGQELHGKNSAYVDVLSICRQVTFRTTLWIFFGICDVTKTRLNEDETIHLIIQYFKAWEYMLIRPTRYVDEQILTKHLETINLLQKKVVLLLEIAEEVNSDVYFFKKVSESNSLIGKNNRVQIALEMLLAGTDTSSVSMYYAVLALSEYDSIHERLSNDIISLRLKSCSDELQNKLFYPLLDTSLEKTMLASFESPYLKHFIYETLRCKPVGPVVIRRAVSRDVLPNGMMVKPGDGIIINLETMHHNSKYFNEPYAFNPDRFPKEEEHFYPFGHELKSCVGRWLGTDEMKATLSILTTRYKFSTKGKVTLKGLETHWDIANQPQSNELIHVTKQRRGIPIIITGAHSTGKTTLLEQLVQLNDNDIQFNVIREIARNFLKTKGWTREILSTNKAVLKECQFELLKLQNIAEQKMLENGSFISDRGLDPVAYLRWHGEYDSADEALTQPYTKEPIKRYKSCFTVMIEPTNECIHDDSTRMMSTLDELLRLNNILEKLLQEHQLPYFIVSKVIPLNKRAETVMQVYKRVLLNQDLLEEFRPQSH